MEPITTLPTPAYENVKRVLAESCRTHLGRMAQPVQIPQPVKEQPRA